MEEQLITSVSYHPANCPCLLGYMFQRMCVCVFAVDVCRKRWKGLRDVYMRDRQIDRRSEAEMERLYFVSRREMLLPTRARRSSNCAVDTRKYRWKRPSSRRSSWSKR